LSSVIKTSSIIVFLSLSLSKINSSYNFSPGFNQIIFISVQDALDSSINLFAKSIILTGFHISRTNIIQFLSKVVLVTTRFIASSTDIKYLIISG
jgi:hypothetical protein